MLLLIKLLKFLNEQKKILVISNYLFSYYVCDFISFFSRLRGSALDLYNFLTFDGFAIE